MLCTRDDLPALRWRFSIHSRILIPDFLEPAFAQKLLDAARAHDSRTLVTRVDGAHREFDSAQMERVPRERLTLF